MVHIGISAHQDDIELLYSQALSLWKRHGQEAWLLCHVSLWKGLGAKYTLRRQVGNRLQNNAAPDLDALDLLDYRVT
jgi:hypothetical protein